MRVGVVTLAIGLDERTKRVIGVFLNFLHDVHLWRSGMFVRVEHDVCTIRHIIRIHGHALQVVGPIHKDANLSIVRIP